MLALKEEGIDVPKTIYGSLWYLYELTVKAIRLGGSRQAQNRKKYLKEN